MNKRFPVIQYGFYNYRLIKYIIGDDCTKGLEPHLVGKTVCINEARRLITQLSQPLADITTLIEDNLRTLERHIQHLRLENSTLEELKTKLYMPIINLKVINLAQPATVCASDTCTKIYQVRYNDYNYYLVYISCIVFHSLSRKFICY